MGNKQPSASVPAGPWQYRTKLVTFAALAALLTALLVAGPAGPQAGAASPCGATINPIVCENQKPGTDPAVWDIAGAGDSSIQGFATDISVNAGQRIDFKVDTDARAYKIDLYRTGWYQGLGARFITSVPVTAALPQRQPQCITDVATELYDCGTWGVSASWNVPADAVSGVYIAKLTRTDNNDSSHILFIVRNDGNRSDVLFQTSDPTWQAYNPYGGSNFYQGAANGRAYQISYNRPVTTRGTTEWRSFYFSAEYATVRFLERNGYDVSYLAGVDTDRRGGELLNHKAFLSVGHDEYWSGAQRRNMEAARDAGVNLQFLSGNEGYWRTRYAASADPSRTAYRTLISYKETWASAKIDPSPEWTGTWRDPRLADASAGGHLPENGLTGTMYMVNDISAPLTVTSAEGSLRLWRGTGLSGLANGATANLGQGIVGYESDEDIDNGFRPRGLIRMSTTTAATSQYLYDYGNNVAAGNTRHNITMYRAPSGALVFSAGTVQWGWGLDDEHDGTDAGAVDVRLQQAEVNLLADMGAQPGSLMSGLVAATKSTDTTAPTVAITTPTAGQSIANGTQVTATGTASDVGGRVAGVEYSSDGGATWHPAQGTANWTFSYIQAGIGTAALVVRAIDDSANYSTAGTSRSLNITGPASVFGNSVPAVASASDAGSYELGLRFTPGSDGFITGVRFYKGAGNGGTHVGSLWDASGTRLASVSFANESASGWQTAEFLNPVEVVAGTRYTVSYTAPQGRYASTELYWPYKSVSSAPLSVNNVAGPDAPGVYGNAGSFPTATYKEGNYYVDVLFTQSDSSPLRISSRTPVAGASSVPLNTVITATFTRPADPATVGITVKDAAGAAIAGTVSYDAATRTARFAPVNALAASTTYTVTPTAKDTNGVALDAASAWSFTTQGVDLPEGQCPCSLYPESSAPAVASDADRQSVTLGVRFSVQTAGKITALKFYKGSANVGTHIGTLWGPTGTQLSTATFQNESATGWQTVTLPAPVSVVPGQTYTASYVAPAGGYAVTAGQFASGYVRGPLTVPASGGTFTYSGGYPTQSSSTSYGVDVVFTPGVVAPNLVSTSPQHAALDVAPTAVISAAFSGAMASGYQGTVKADGTTVAGTWALSSDAKTIAFTPSAALPRGASVSVALTGLAGANGAAASDVGWSFVVAAAAGQTISTFFAGTTPTVEAESGDTSSVELGLAFTTSVVGEVRAIRFYKGPGNSGAHVGSLWGQDGTRLAQVTFTGESAGGWQRAVLSNPVVLGPGQTYTVSYLAPVGRYSYTSAGLATERTSGPLKTIVGENGRYRYGAGGTMPTSSFNATNYFVDVEFVVESTLAVTNPAPARGADGVAVDAAVSATVGGVSATQTPSITVTGPGGAIAGTSTFTRSTSTVRFVPAAALLHSGNYTAAVILDGVTLDSWAFRVAAAPAGSMQTLFGGDTPDVAAVADTGAVEVGTVFTVGKVGKVTAIRFYKAAANTGVHRGTLWDSAGTALSQVTFVAESSSGWQTAALATPISVSPGQTYVVSYLAPNGAYSYTGGYFATAKVSGDITGPATANGRFRYGAAGGFPDQSSGASGYFVDPVIDFRPSLTSVSPAAGATNVAVTAQVTATLSNATTASLGLTLGGAAVGGASAFDPATGVATFTPSAPLQRGRTYSATVTANGGALAGGTWTFSTVPEGALVSTTPAASATNVDPATVSISATLTNAESASLAVTTGGASVAGTSAFNATTGVVTFTPSATLAVSKTYTVTATANGAAVANGTWSFTTIAAATLTATSPAAAATGVDPATVKITATLSGAASGSLVLKAGTTTVAGTSSFNASTGVVTFTPAAALGWTTAYTATVTANGTAVANGTWSFTTMAKQDQVSLFTTGTPTNANANATLAYQTGTRIRVSAPGVVTTIRYYKGSQNTGTHTGYLRSANGTVLAQVTFRNETSSGWQTAVLSAPVRLTVGTEYRVTLLSSSGRYAVTNGALASAVTVGPLSTIANGGVAGFGSGNPTTVNGNKYWVDVVFDPDN
ncbi:MAG TPA: DUF4082 domain-containing protein [Microbacterium sp.]|nr:DUF4082 domain-containing protein [Microbacterium sp.]